MELLSVKKVKDSKEEKTQTQQKKVARLASEESRLTKLINDRTTFVKKEKARLSGELKQHKELIAKRKIELTKELAPLEEQNQKSLALIDEGKKEVAQRECDLERGKQRLNEDRIIFIENESDSQQQQDEKSDELDVRQEKVKAVETELDINAKSLTRKWIAYHIDAKTQTNWYEEMLEEMSEREFEVSVREEKAEIKLQQGLQRVNREMDRARRLIKISKYGTTKRT